jgi:transposase-like protein
VRYSDDEKMAMVDEYRRQRSLKRTAEIFGCSTRTVRAAVVGQGIEVYQPIEKPTCRRYPQATRDEMVRVYGRVQSLERTARVFG